MTRLIQLAFAVVFMSLTSLVLAKAPYTYAVSLLVDDFVFTALAMSPTNATGVGLHEHGGSSLDDILDDYSPQGIAANRSRLTVFMKRIDRLAGQNVDLESHADLEVMRDAVAAMLLEFDEIQSYRHNPTLYVEIIGNGLFSPFALNYAPAGARFLQIIHRLQQVPRFVDQAMKNLRDSPEAWNRAARAENAGNIDLVDHKLRAECPPELRVEYAEAAAPALRSLMQFSHWLEADLSRKQSNWRLGKDLYAKKFRYVIEIDESPEKVLAAAEADLLRTRADMVRLVAPRTVEQVLEELASRHASREGYMASAQDALNDATAFVNIKDLVALPQTGNLRVIETPDFLRENYSVGGFNAAPALEPWLGAYYWVTPIPADWPSDKADSKLREYNESGLRHLTVHEAMPGHYVQTEYANTVEPRSRRLLRSIFGNQAYSEGWAVYAQQLMAEAGYQSDTVGYRLTLLKQQLRALANVIIDIRLQTLGMTDDEALDLMIKQTYQEREEAVEKLERAKLSSVQLATYYVGYNAWVKVRAQYEERHHEDFNLKTFHQAVLNEGAVPLRMLDRLIREKHM
jgi:uncharacterized protein (DUF885 family)